MVFHEIGNITRELLSKNIFRKEAGWFSEGKIVYREDVVLRQINCIHNSGLNPKTASVLAS